MSDVIAYKKTYNGMVESKFMQDAELRLASNMRIGNYTLNYGIKVIYNEGKRPKGYFLEFLTPELRQNFWDQMFNDIHIKYDPLIWNDQTVSKDIHFGELTLTHHMIRVVRKLLQMHKIDYILVKNLKAFEHFSIADIRNLLNDSRYIIPHQLRKPELWALTLQPPSKLKLQGISHLDIWKKLCER